jgi:hypothetical protein
MTEGDKQSLSYESPAGSPVPRWQFRLLFLLVLVNFAITIQMAYAPGVTSAVGKWWTDHRAQRRMRALYQQASTWSAPAGTVVWEEDAEAAAKLRATGGYIVTQMPYQVFFGHYPSLKSWPRGAAINAPGFAAQLQEGFPIYDNNGRIPQADEDWALLLLHELRSPGGKERLVYVVVESKVDLGEPRAPFGPDARHDNPLEVVGFRRLRLIATSCAKNGATLLRPQRGETTELFIVPGGRSLSQGIPVPWRWEPAQGGKPGEVRVESPYRFRFYAAQPDPADASHFTIDYDLNDTRGKIHGRLKDDGTIDLKPEAGTVALPVWDPLAK